MKCRCPSCVHRYGPEGDDRRCAFCARYCPDVREYGHNERSFAGILCWRIHRLLEGIEGEGLDPLVWYPLVIEHGTLDKAQRAQWSV